MAYPEPYIEYRTSPSRILLRFPEGEERFIEIAPGTSFGSNHNTTRLCLRAIEEVLKAGKMEKVLDLGCGSGILAISAAALGADSVLAMDIDPIAVEEAIKNVERNGVSTKVRVLRASLEGAKERYDLVMANIVTDELLRLAEGIKKVMKENGVLVVSGISELKREKAISGFKEAGFGLIREFTEDGWVAIWFELSSRMDKDFGGVA
ncbi:MAG TPA: 50S ribosomal protein L11 methyltransferase [Thermodesulfobacteriota bacterium]|nr:50S ribosomal protein L11 methyltransferase [Thermodesulfobacteriota bacterium]